MRVDYPARHQGRRLAVKSILDPAFRYTPSTHTNLRATFARVRRELKSAAEARATEHVVLALPAPKSKGR